MKIRMFFLSFIFCLLGCCLLVSVSLAETFSSQGCFSDSHSNLSHSFGQMGSLQAILPSLGTQSFDKVFGILKDFPPEPVEFVVDKNAFRFDAYAQIIDGRRLVKLNLGLLFGVGIDEDVLALVACHEMGHHFGGSPAYSKPPMSFEGQADFYSTQSCYEYWVRKSDVHSESDLSVVDYCQRVLGRDDDFCRRTLSASLRLTQNLAKKSQLEGTDLLLSDSTVVDDTLEKHAVPQCRLDTFKAGYICKDRGCDSAIARPACWFARTMKAAAF